MMKNVMTRALLACCLLVFSAFGFAAEKQAANSVVWRVFQGKASEPVGYLVGTMHVGKARETLPANVQTAWDDSDSLLLESLDIDSDNLTSESFQELMLLAFNEPQTLAQNLGEKRAKQLYDFVHQHQPKLAMMLVPEAKTNPQFAMFSAALALVPADYQVDEGVDKRLLLRAKAENRAVQGLEENEAIKILQRLSLPTTKKQIDVLLAQEKALRADMVAAIQAYEKQDVTELNRLFDEEYANRFLPNERAELERVFSDGLMGERNRAWLPKIMAAWKKQRTLVAVGMGHLLGKHSLIKMLQRKGYRVEAVLP
ncbi:MAG: TraB/GumN family protein [Neisseria sp.]|nr:TraB/GumN family protein [Neisseria sp.]